MSDPNSLIKKKPKKPSPSAVLDAVSKSSIFVETQDPNVPTTFEGKAKEIKLWRLLASMFWTCGSIIGLVITLKIGIWLFSFFVNIDGNTQSSTFKSLLTLILLCILQCALLFAQYKTISVRHYQSGRHSNRLVLLKELTRTNHLIFAFGHLLITGFMTSIFYVRLFHYDQLIFAASPIEKPKEDATELLLQEYQQNSLKREIVQQQYTFVIFCSLVASVLWILRYFVKKLYEYKFPMERHTRWSRLKNELPLSFRVALRFSIVSLGCTLILYLLMLIPYIRDLFSPLFSSLILHRITSYKDVPGLYNGVDFSLNIPFLWQCLTVSFLTLMTAEFSRNILNAIHTELFHFGNYYMLEALTNHQSPYIQYLGFLYLHHVAYHSKSNRSFLFKDNGGEGWKFLLNRCCDIIDDITTSLSQIKQKKIQERKAIAAGEKKKSEVTVEEDPFLDFQLQVSAIEAVSHLTSQSLNEDDIGVVQNNNSVPVLLQSLLNCLVTLEEHIHSKGVSGEMDSYAAAAILKRKNLVQGGNEEKEGGEVPKAHLMITVLNNAIREIVTTFYDHLSYFEFPPNTSAKLQSFVSIFVPFSACLIAALCCGFAFGVH